VTSFPEVVLQAIRLLIVDLVLTDIIQGVRKKVPFFIELIMRFPLTIKFKGLFFRTLYILLIMKKMQYK